MRKTILFGLILFSLSSFGQQLFYQDFDFSTDLKDYYNRVPSVNQFDEISPSRKNMEVSIQNGALRLHKTGPAYAFFLRKTPIEKLGNLISIRFKLKLENIVEGGTNQLHFYVGSNLPGRADAIDTNNCHSRFGINFANPESTDQGFSLRNIETGKNSKTFRGEQYITMMINNSNKPQIYLSPAGTEVELAPDNADLWVGQSKALKDVKAFGAGVELEGIKLIYVYGAKNGTVNIDDIEIKSIK